MKETRTVLLSQRDVKACRMAGESRRQCDVGVIATVMATTNRRLWRLRLPDKYTATYTVATLGEGGHAIEMDELTHESRQRVMDAMLRLRQYVDDRCRQWQREKKARRP